MKKIIVGVFAFAIIFASQTTFASSVWNGVSNDCPGIAVANHTTNTGIIVPCWPLKSVSANQGNSVNIRIYYHNTSNLPATNVKVFLDAPTGAASSHTFSGRITSDQGSLSLGNVTVNTPSGSTLSLPTGGVHWLPNQKQTDSSLPNGQSGSSILSSGISLGTIAPGWDTQGSVVVVFAVSGPSITDPTGTLTANKDSCSIEDGQKSCEINFAWNTTNANGTSIVKNGGTSVATGNSGSKAFTVPYNSATFKLYNNGIELDSKTVTSACTSGAAWNGSVCSKNIGPDYSCSIESFTVGGSLSSNISLGDSVEFAWTTTGCNYVNIEGIGNNLASSGTKTISPNTSGTYKLTGFGSSGTNPTRSISVTVTPGSSYTCSITSFTTDSTSITSGDSATISWDTENCLTVNISNIGNNLEASGQKTVYPTKTTTYTLTANTSSGTKPTRAVTVNVSGTSSYACSITSFTADSISITYGDSAMLSWNTENCATANISNVGNNLEASGQKTVYPTKTTTYILTGNSSSSTKPSRSVTINVFGTPTYACSITSFSANDTSVSKDDPVTLFWETENCATVSITNVGTNLTASDQKTIYPTKTTTYIITGNSTSSIKPTRSLTVTVSNAPKYDCSINDFTSSDTSIEEGDSVTLRWDTEDCDDVSISEIGDVESNGSKRIYPDGDTTYVLTAYDSWNTRKTKTIRVYVDNNNYNNNGNNDNIVIYNSSVITTLATNVSETAATLNGIVTSSNSGNANTYFEYGTSVNVGQRTNSKAVNGNSNFSEYITGLSSNTIYYFRAVSTGNNGTSRGSMEIFRTLGYNVVNTGDTNTQVIRYVTIPGTTVTGTASPIMLKIENRYEAIGEGDIIDYTVTYKNISKNTLTDSVLQVVVPKGITITNASKGTFSNDTHTLSVELNDLTPGEEGIVYVQGRVDSIPTDQAKIVSTAILVYTSNSGAQENAIAYVLNVPKNFNNGNVLGASAFFSGFGGIGLIGWLLILILILLAVIIARSYSQRRAYIGLNSLKK